MKGNDILASAEATAKPLNEATHLPGFFYTSPEIYEMEREHIFLKDWLPVGRVEEAEKPGDFFTFEVVGEPLIIARDREGRLNAFVNRCAHRGVRVAYGNGNTKEFMCPYHGWLYDLKGGLAGAPHMDQAVGFDKSLHGLQRLALGVWAGWVFVSFSDNPVPFEEWVAPYEKELGFLRQQDCRLSDKVIVDVSCNWKFPVENLMDNYHTPVLHVKSIGPTVQMERFTKLEGPLAFTAYQNAKAMTADGKSRFGIMPALEGRENKASFHCSAHIAPNMQLFARSDSVHPFIMWPLGPNKVRVMCYMLWPAECHDDPDFRAKVQPYIEFTRQLMDEDLSVMESLHEAASSSRYKPGRLSRYELGVYNLLNYHVGRITGKRDPKLY